MGTSKSSKKPTVKALSTTLVVLVASSIASSAGAQAVPATRPGASGTQQTAAPASATAPSTGIDRSKCSADLKEDEAKLKSKIVEAIRAASKKYKPAIAYEGRSHGVAVKPTTQLIDEAANKQASMLASSLIAAIESPKSPANAASQALNGNPNRRASLKYYHRCAGRDSSPTALVDNEQLPNSSCGSTAWTSVSQDAGISVSQVYESSWSPLKVTEAFARSKISSKPPSQVVKACFDTAEKCVHPSNYSEYSPETLKLNSSTMNREIFMMDDLEVKSGMDRMVQFNVMKVISVPFCGSNVYLVTAFANGHKFGLERSSLIGLVGQVGNKTLVLGNMSAQSYKTHPNETDPWPLWTVKQPGSARDPILGPEGYPAIAKKIGSTENVVMGVVQGSGGQRRSRPADLDPRRLLTQTVQ